jgi:predicted chitinase
MSNDRQNKVLLDAYAAGIKSPAELANYMAQVTHESLDLKRLNEGFKYSHASIKFQYGRLFAMVAKSWKKLASKHFKESPNILAN